MKDIAILLVPAACAVMFLFVFFGRGLRKSQRPGPKSSPAAQEQLEAVGRLVGNIGQDLERLLIRIEGEFQELSGERKFPRESSDRIARALDQAAALVRQLSVIGRPRYLIARPVEVAGRLRQLSDGWRPLLRDNVVLDIAEHGSHCVVRVDPGEFDSTMFTLVANARDSIPQGGTISISIDTDVPPHLSAASAADFATIKIAAVPDELLSERAPDMRVDHPPAPADPLREVYEFCRKFGGAVSVSDSGTGETCAALRLPLAPTTG